MNDQERKLLARNRQLLVGNIILTDEFYRRLKSESVLPDTMIRDIQMGKTREERNTILLDMLHLGGGTAYRKFRNVLNLTGHRFLADHLHGEESDVRILKPDDVFNKFPEVFFGVTSEARAKLLRYMETKMKEKTLLNSWLKAGQERNDLLEARRDNFDTLKESRLRTERSNKKIQQLKEEINQLREEVLKRDTEISEMTKTIDKMESDFKAEFATQMRFNTANNRSVMQLQDRVDDINERLRVLNTLVEDLIGKSDDVDLGDSPVNDHLQVLENNMKKVADLIESQNERRSVGSSEVAAIVELFPSTVNAENFTPLKIVQNYLGAQEKIEAVLTEKLETVLNIARGRKVNPARKLYDENNSLHSLVANIRVEVEHLQKKIGWKDDQISTLIQESNKNGVISKQGRSDIDIDTRNK